MYAYTASFSNTMSPEPEIALVTETPHELRRTTAEPAEADTAFANTPPDTALPASMATRTPPDAATLPERAPANAISAQAGIDAPLIGGVYGGAGVSARQLRNNGDTDGGWINANSFSTVYRNVDLDDIEPVEVDNLTNRNNRPWVGSNPQVRGRFRLFVETISGDELE